MRSIHARQATERNVVGAAVRWIDEVALKGFAVVPFDAPGTQSQAILGAAALRHVLPCELLDAVDMPALAGAEFRPCSGAMPPNRVPSVPRLTAPLLPYRVEAPAKKPRSQSPLASTNALASNWCSPEWSAKGSRASGLFSRSAPKTKACSRMSTPAAAQTSSRTRLAASGSNITKTPRWRVGGVTAPQRRSLAMISSATPATA